MSSFNIKKPLVFLFITLTIINVVILGTIAFYLIFKPKQQLSDNNQIFDCPNYYDDLTLKRYSNFKYNYRNNVFPLFDSLNQLQFAIIEELEKDYPDTNKLNSLAEESGAVYTSLRKRTIKQLAVNKDSFPKEYRRCFFNNYQPRYYYKNRRANNYMKAKDGNFYKRNNFNRHRRFSNRINQ